MNDLWDLFVFFLLPSFLLFFFFVIVLVVDVGMLYFAFHLMSNPGCGIKKIIVDFS